MEDRIFAAFLTRQYEEGMALVAASDLVELLPLGEMPPSRYIARFRCKGLVQTTAGALAEADCFDVGIWFPAEYLRHAEPFEVLTWLGPADIFHPNISNRLPAICIGKVAPSTPLVDLLYRCFEVITWNKVTMREDDALNPEACVWARRHPDRFPIDRRPLKRRALDLKIEFKQKAG